MELDNSYQLECYHYNLFNWGDGSMIYSFRQNNSGGYYTKPAKFIVVSGANDSEHASEIAMQIGMYTHGVAAGMDCSCCGDRWYNMADEYDSLADALLDLTRDDILRDSMRSDGVPHYIVVDDLDVADTILE
jgi:hypothetical protein